MTDASMTHCYCTASLPSRTGLIESNLFTSTVPIILPSEKNVLPDTMFKLSTGYKHLNSRLGSRICRFITPNINMVGYPTNGFFIGKV